MYVIVAQTQALQREVHELQRRLLQSEEQLRSAVEEHEQQQAQLSQQLQQAQAAVHSPSVRAPARRLSQAQLPADGSKLSLTGSQAQSHRGQTDDVATAGALPEVPSDEAMLLMVQEMIGPDGSTPNTRRVLSTPTLQHAPGAGSAVVRSLGHKATLLAQCLDTYASRCTALAMIFLHATIDMRGSCNGLMFSTAGTSERAYCMRALSSLDICLHSRSMS